MGIWQIRPIPVVVENDNKRLSRYPKSHPETLLSYYKASLYIDANIQILDRWVYDRFINLYDQNIEHAGIKLVLTGRDCIYEHAFDMCMWLVEHDYVAIKQCHELYKRGFPRHFGLNENNIIFRIHTERMKVVDEEWWQWILNFSTRDQLSYMYCIWKNHVPLNYFLPEGEDARISSHFRLVIHDSRPHVLKTKIVKRSLFERLRVKSRLFNKEGNMKRWLFLCKTRYPVTLLYLDGIINIITNAHNLLKSVIERKA